MKDSELYAARLGWRHPWHVREVQLDFEADRVDVGIEEAAGAKFACPDGGKSAPLYDHVDEREWRHLDTCHCQTYVQARLPRVQCPDHGVRQVRPSWATAGAHSTLRFENLVIDTLQECDVTGVRRLTGMSWDEAWRIREQGVVRGIARKERRIPRHLSSDEKSFAQRHRYETLVCDPERGIVEYVADDRQQDSLERHYRPFTTEELAAVEDVAMDMWDPYIAATQAYVPGADDQVGFDKFHVVRIVTEAVDQVRRQEHKILSAKGDDRLKGTQPLWLANEANVPDGRRAEFESVKAMNLRTGRAWAIKESLRKFWTFHSPKRAVDYFRRGYFWATHSRLAPRVSAAKTLKRHWTHILTYFKHRISNATAEGLNSKIQMVKEMACGFRNREHYKTAIYFHCGGLDLYPRLEESS